MSVLFCGISILLVLLVDSVSPTCEDPIQGTYVSSSSRYGLAGDIRLPIPSHTKAGDLLLLFLSRTDDVLPLELDGWVTGPSCFKEHNKGNHVRQCWTAEDCLESKTSAYSGVKYCSRFPRNHTGEDLATIVFYRTVASNYEANGILQWNLPGYNPAWATLAVISGVNTTNPIRSSARTSCDKKAAGVFPSVYGEPGDVLLLSMAHDDPADPLDFQPPMGTQLIEDQHGSDEAGFLFAGRLNISGKTPTYATRGAGTQWWCKDALLSVVLHMLPSDDNQDLLILNNGNDPCSHINSSGAVIFSDVLSGIVNILKWINARWRIFG